MGAVRTWAQAQLWSHSQQQIEQLLALTPLEIRAELVLEGDRSGHPPREHASSLLREMECVGAAILRIGPPLQQVPLLQSIDERDHPARRYLQALAYRLLRLTLCGGDGAQQRELTRLELQGRKRLTKATRDRVAEAREVEADGAKRCLRRIRGHR